MTPDNDSVSPAANTNNVSPNSVNPRQFTFSDNLTTDADPE